ncbi:MAG: 23S rRNA (pseudouridine(1915)-N(3))-methyltransferase RlmH [Gammaproteobacteria bacterium]|nr:23S rRNA (pseudouridine(1915)-N(3))-methyltransferase RlmH [Gammaproteobacteria bacterium]|tara:strand:+ start:246 stop:716 length:471 start_codon:yes stop_codon:yes gene_type:complete
MKISLIAVGSKMPDWVESGIEEYGKRLPAEFSFSIKEVPAAIRSKNSTASLAMEKEAQGIQQAIGKHDYVIALDEVGRDLNTKKLAGELRRLRDDGRDIAFVIGGADGLADSFLQTADARWSLSALTFPHPLVRVILTEQIYRAWSLLQGHPYHRS